LPIPRQIPLDVPPVLQIAPQLAPIVLQLLAGLPQPLAVCLDGGRVGAVAQVVSKLLPRVVELAPVRLDFLSIVADLAMCVAKSLPVLLDLLEVAANFGRRIGSPSFRGVRRASAAEAGIRPLRAWG
jgi:hypothetical protein